jgi:hypothetical protein
MTDETDFEYSEDTEDDDYVAARPRLVIPNSFIQIGKTIFAVILAAATGYCIGWAASLLLERVGS